MSSLLVLLSLLGLASTAWCCNDFLYNSSTGAFSGRLLDLGPNLNPSVGYIPRGAQLEGLRVSLESGIKKYQATYGFAIASSLREELNVISRLTGFTSPSVGGATDCLNEKGLSVGLLYDSLSEPPKYPNITRNGNFISTFDFAAYACSQFADVSEVKQGIANGLKLAAPYDPVPQPAPSPYHYSVRDAQRNMLVIEYTPTDELRLYDASDFGVLTNNPEYSVHQAQVESFLANGVNGAAPTYLTAPQGGPDYVNVTFTDDNQLAITPQGDDQWWPFPGDYNSVSRFIRLYMLNRFAQESTQYPLELNATWSPAAYPGGFPFKALFMATEGILNSVALPLGIDDKGGVNPPNVTTADYWQLEVIRDHIDQKFWYRIPSSPQWKLIDVAQAAAQDPQPAYDGYFLAGNFGDDVAWYLDYTQLALQAKSANITSQAGQILSNVLSAAHTG